uniref:NADH dehydrogenase subunit 3 n=1 Tax=Sclerodermus sichuanensis TaxID=592144 RepID=UPI0021144F97|nr:NADH dehydrogenase subunit 3 [Sclerodermus sichuanensis]UTN43174.1 NADH dehydrogenase subunit 3 [Sclerodermus sichuanensis]
MLIMFMQILFIMITLMWILFKFNSIISQNMMNNRIKSSPFECGFKTFYSGNSNTEMKFFIIGLIYLIFDIEINILIPMTYQIMHMYHSTLWLMAMMFFIIFMISTLIIEWFMGNLFW